MSADSRGKQLTLVRGGLHRLSRRVDFRAEVLQLVSLYDELNHILQLHLISRVHDVLVILEHTNMHAHTHV